VPKIELTLLYYDQTKDDIIQVHFN